MDYTVQHLLWPKARQQKLASEAYYDLYLILRGAAVFRCGNGADLIAGQEDLILFKPGETALLVFPGAHAPLEIIRVQLSESVLNELSDAETNLLAAFNVVPFRQLAVRADSEIYMLLKNLARKLLALPREKNNYGASLFERGLLQMFVVMVLRTCIQAERHKSKGSRHRLMLDDVFLYIQAHLDEEITLKQLAKQFYVTRAYIERQFKQQTGQTIHHYIVKAKLDRCCLFIEQGYPIVEVYKMGGFGGYNNFFRAFKKEYGMTPKEYFRTVSASARG